MITTMKQDSKRFEVEQAQRRQQGRQQGTYSASSAIFDDGQIQGRPDVPQSGYPEYDIDIGMDGSDRREDPSYRDQDPRMDRMDMRHRGQYSRQPLQINRHGLPVSQGYPQEPAYPSAYQIPPISSGYYDLASSQPRTLGPNNTPPPPMGSSSEAIYRGIYPVTTSASYPVAAPLVSYQAGARQPGWGDTPNFQTDTAR